MCWGKEEEAVHKRGSQRTLRATGGSRSGPGVCGSGDARICFSEAFTVWGCSGSFNPRNVTVSHPFLATNNYTAAEEQEFSRRLLWRLLAAPGE